MKIVWIGFIVPESLSIELAASDKYITAQTQAFQSRVVRALELQNHQVSLVSSPPITDWSSIRRVRLRWWQHSSGCEDVVVPTVNIVGLKQLTVFGGCLIGVMMAAYRAGTKAKPVIVLGDSYAPHLLAALVAKWLFRLPVCAIVTDLPGLIAVADPWYKRLLRPLDKWMVHRQLQETDGLVVLSEHIAHDFFPGKPFHVMPGVIDDHSAIPEPHPSGQSGDNGESKPFVIMYAGALVIEYGVALLLEAFKQLPGTGFELWITGRGDFEPQLIDAARTDPRVRFFGYLPRPDLVERMQQANALISLRLTHQGHARYSFPSKLIEYMQHNAYVITNHFPSLPDDFASYLAVLEIDTPEALRTLILSLQRGDYGTISQFAARMKAFVQQRASLPEEGRRLSRFLHQIAPPEQ